MDIYAQLRSLLQTEYDHGATDQEIADRLGCSQQQINNLRNGKRSFHKMRLETLLQLFPNLSIALDGVPIHGRAATINGNGNIIVCRDANGNNISLPATVCSGEIESFRAGLIHGVIDLEVDDTAKVAFLRFIKDYRKRGEL